jgi:hypothetical protein
MASTMIEQYKHDAACTPQGAMLCCSAMHSTQNATNCHPTPPMLPRPT